MTYGKPAIATAGSPLMAIRGTHKDGNVLLETLVPPSDPRYGTYTLTVNAYEADE